MKYGHYSFCLGIHEMPRHYMKCPTDGRYFLKRLPQLCGFPRFPPKVDRGPLDPANIHAVITDARNDVYQLSTRAGVIKGWFPRSALRETDANEVGVVGTDRTLGLREAFREQSLFGGQGMKQCACRASAKQCNTKRCKYRKAGMMCTNRFHAALPCVNK